MSTDAKANHTLTVTDHLACTLGMTVSSTAVGLCLGFTLDWGWATTHKVLITGFPHNRKSQEALSLRKCLGVWHIYPLWCPDLWSGDSESTFSPSSPAVGVKKPWTASFQPESYFLTLTFLWPHQLLELFSSTQPRLHLLLPVLLAKVFSQPTLLIPMGQKEVTATNAKNDSKIKTLLLRREHTLKMTSGVESQDPSKTLHHSQAKVGKRPNYTTFID